MVQTNLPDWRQKLKSSQHKEGKSPLKRWIQLSTISKQNKPRVRTVVFRGWISANSMIIYTDSRSEKIKDITINNNVELLWLFLKSKSQYRMRGKANFVKDNIHYWNKLTLDSRKTWFWPDPGEILDQNFPNINLENLNKPVNFIVLEIKIDSVELLKLENPVHKRYRWEIDKDWKCEELNP